MKVSKQCFANSTKLNNHICLALMLFLTSVTASVHAADNNNLQILIRPDEIFQGDVALLSISAAQNIQSASYEWQNQTIDCFYDKEKDAFLGFLPIDLTEPAGNKALQITIHDNKGRKSTKKIAFKIIEKSFPTQRLTLPEGKVTLSKKDLARHNREKARLKKVFNKSIPEKIWKKSFIKPLKGKISTPFGVKRIINNIPKNPHSGVDLKAPQGAEVVCTSDGIVAFTGDHFFSGNSVFIDHGLGIFSMYFHLSSISVKQGARIARGQTVGFVGSTGRATGPHLHWGIRINGQRVEPLSLLKLFKQ
jgi:murein DD-endopeptidase MepM/ murein hydrolase activator NlpD